MQQPEGTIWVKTTIDVLSGKWKLLILWHLKDEPKRFGELRRLIPGVSEKVLTQQLRGLEKDEIIRRDVIPGNPATVEYSFTEYGKAIIPIIETLCKWGEIHYKRMQQPDSEETI